MPARTDHEARRRDVSAAVWRVLARDGFGGLTIRTVAAELNASTGMVTHYFGDKRTLIRHALELAEERTRSLTPDPPDLRSALVAVLPLTPESVELNRVWVSSWDPSLADDELRRLERARYQRWRDRLRPLVEQAQANGELPAGDPDDLAASVAALTHGLVIQALFDPRRFPRKRLLRLLDLGLKVVDRSK